MRQPLFESQFTGLNCIKKGKVRDIYDLGDSLLMVATDRISAFDVIMPNPIPDKGKVLTQISIFWFNYLKSMVKNHVIAHKVSDYPEACHPYAEELEGRSMQVRKAEPLPIECVVRGYLSGSGWSSYKNSKSVCGIELPAGLRESDKLPEPIFTPSTKADLGEHDVNIDFSETIEKIGKDTAEKVKTLSLEIYRKGVELAEQRGIIIADTKFEFGLLDGELILIDEVLTPDSSRFWPKEAYRPGGPQKSFDKQYLRDYLLSLDWDKTPPGPSLPDEVVANTRKKYIEALHLITGESDVS